MRYFIIGYKSSGKTTLGRKLALKLSLEFIDLDEAIEKREGQTIPQLYIELGDTGFRNREWEALLEVVKRDDVVVALGGGAPCYCDNMNLIMQYGDVIYLRLETEELVSRLKMATRNRPIVLNKSDEELRNYILELREKCEHHYLRAKYIIDAWNISEDKILEVIGR